MPFFFVPPFCILCNGKLKNNMMGLLYRTNGDEDMIGRVETKLPEFFGTLMELGCLSETKVYSTSDGFFAAATSVADILAHRDITTVPDRQGNPLECRLFFDDWYLYAVSEGDNDTYSLFKMREQEHDAKLGLYADGDTPGVTVPFIALRKEILLDCLNDPTPEKRMQLNEEINRVVAYGRQRHSETLKGYFIRTEAQGAYLIAQLYTEYIASLAGNGSLAVPERYASDYKKQGARGRVPRFIEENNRDAGKVICDHKNIYISDPLCPTELERLAILATHAGNTSFCSFATEVQFHARFLTWWARIPIPFIGRSPYASAIRADMSIGDAEFTGPTPYYRPNSRIVRRHRNCHKDKY